MINLFRITMNHRMLSKGGGVEKGNPTLTLKVSCPQTVGYKHTTVITCKVAVCSC